MSIQFFVEIKGCASGEIVVLVRDDYADGFMSVRSVDWFNKLYSSLEAVISKQPLT